MISSIVFKFIEHWLKTSQTDPIFSGVTSCIRNVTTTITFYYKCLNNIYKCLKKIYKCFENWLFRSYDKERCISLRIFERQMYKKKKKCAHIILYRTDFRIDSNLSYTRELIPIQIPFCLHNTYHWIDQLFQTDV